MPERPVPVHSGPATLAAWMHGAEKVAIFTGAGMSTLSGAMDVDARIAVGLDAPLEL